MLRNLLLKEFIQSCNKDGNTLLSPLGYEIIIQFLKHDDKDRSTFSVCVTSELRANHIGCSVLLHGGEQERELYGKQSKNVLVFVPQISA